VVNVRSLDDVLNVRLDSRASYYLGDFLDGRVALSPTAVRVARRCRGRLGVVGDVQDHGAASAAGDHDAGDDRFMDFRALDGCSQRSLFGDVVPSETSAYYFFIGLSYGDGGVAARFSE
jgi:hypothetical protein